MQCGCNISTNDICELFHSNENRSLRVSTINNLTYDIMCYDQCALRTLYYVILSRCSALQKAQDPLVSATNIVSNGYPLPQSAAVGPDPSKFMAKGFRVSKTVGPSGCIPEGTRNDIPQPEPPSVEKEFFSPSSSSSIPVYRGIGPSHRGMSLNRHSDPMYMAKGDGGSPSEQLIQARTRIARLEASLKARDSSVARFRDLGKRFETSPQAMSPYTESEISSLPAGTPTASQFGGEKVLPSPLKGAFTPTGNPDHDRLPPHPQPSNRQSDELTSANARIKELERQLQTTPTRQPPSDKKELDAANARIRNLEKQLQSDNDPSTPKQNELLSAKNRVRELENQLQDKMKNRDTEFEMATKQISELEAQLRGHSQNSELEAANNKIQALQKQLARKNYSDLDIKDTESTDEILLAPMMSSTLPLDTSDTAPKELTSALAKMQTLKRKVSENNEQQLEQVLTEISKLESKLQSPMAEVLERVSALEKMSRQGTPDRMVLSELTSPNSSQGVLRERLAQSGQAQNTNSPKQLLNEALTRLCSLDQNDDTSKSNSLKRSNENSPSESQLLIKEALACIASIESSRSPSGTLAQNEDANVTDLLKQALSRIEHIESGGSNQNQSSRSSRKNSIIKQPNQGWVTPNGKKVGFATRKQSTYNQAGDDAESESRRKTIPMLGEFSSFEQDTNIQGYPSASFKSSSYQAASTALSSMQVSAATTPGSPCLRAEGSISSVGSFVNSKRDDHHHIVSPLTESICSRDSSRRLTASHSEGFQSNSSIGKRASTMSIDFIKVTEEDDEQGPLLQELQQHSDLPDFRRASILSSAAKSLIIGCGNTEDTSQIAQDMSSCLVQQGFLAEQCILADNLSDSLPTRNNIMNALYWSLRDLPEEAAVFIAIIGQTSKDGSLIPYDSVERGVISTEDMKSVIMDNLPTGCKLTIICDITQGGELIPLPFRVSSTNKSLSEHGELSGPLTDPGVIVQLGANIDDNVTMFPGSVTAPFIQSLNSSAGQSSVGSLLTSIADSFDELDSISPFVSSNKPVSSISSFTLANDLPILHESLTALTDSSAKSPRRRR
eukprot:TRINITY_DN4153_c0_g1_i1.p1 TRINITY_DN4153_c0_g1~~TRINITY_DN4153_c0_g1_i1.p1  ORF type:complete len:1232 (+),score=209.66 TRINITY_DN4153_c0_g1_i1:487-3696(+)